MTANQRGGSPAPVVTNTAGSKQGLGTLTCASIFESPWGVAGNGPVTSRAVVACPSTIVWQATTARKAACGFAPVFTRTRPSTSTSSAPFSAGSTSEPTSDGASVSERPEVVELRADFQAAATVIAKRDRRHEPTDYRIDLRRVDLRRASLMEAQLGGANLSWANLEGADLRGAHLEGARLVGGRGRGDHDQRADCELGLEPGAEDVVEKVPGTIASPPAPGHQGGTARYLTLGQVRGVWSCETTKRRPWHNLMGGGAA